MILFFHAHSFQEHGDFGAGVGVPLGPHALMMQHQLVNQHLLVNADASGTSLVSNSEVPHKNDSKSHKRNELEKENTRGDGHTDAEGNMGIVEKEEVD